MCDAVCDVGRDVVCDVVGDVVCDVVWGGMIDLKLFWGFGNGQTDRLTD